MLCTHLNCPGWRPWRPPTILALLTKVGETGHKPLECQRLPRGQVAGGGPSQIASRCRYSRRPTGLWEIRMNLLRPLLAVLAGAAVFTLVVNHADAPPPARLGSRGSATFSGPPPAPAPAH